VAKNGPSSHCLMLSRPLSLKNLASGLLFKSQLHCSQLEIILCQGKIFSENRIAGFNFFEYLPNFVG